MVAAGDALCDLAQVVAIQQFAQFGLSDQDDLQQLLRGRLEVGQQPHLLEHLAVEVVRLVDHQHHALASRVRAQQVGIEDVDQVLGAVH